MNAVAPVPAEHEAVGRPNANGAFVIDLCDPQVARMQAQLQAGARQAETFLRTLITSACVLGGICLIAQAAKWCAL